MLQRGNFLKKNLHCCKRKAKRQFSAETSSDRRAVEFRLNETFSRWARPGSRERCVKRKCLRSSSALERWRRQSLKILIYLVQLSSGDKKRRNIRILFEAWGKKTLVEHLVRGTVRVLSPSNTINVTEYLKVDDAPHFLNLMLLTPLIEDNEIQYWW